MPLASGTNLGPYEIVAPAGAGGMGEVYRARDTRLDRTVAIKVLPERLAANAEFRQRFEREARAVSSLNHPNICTLHDIGRQDDIDFLVLEYLDGETLADRLASGPLPLEQALRAAIQIADALDKAHRQALTHRDLKPGNIMLTKAGAKLLDFGLAKVSPQSLPGETVALTKALTTEGAIIGTFRYMAPEQLEGKEADARSDIFAFGVVLYEMLTGRKAFEGKTQASVIAAVLGADPPSISTVQPLTPPALDRVVKGCLVKDPDERWQSIHDVKQELEWLQDGAGAVPAQTSTPRWRSAWMVSTAGLLLALCVLAFLHFREIRPTPEGLRFFVSAPEKSSFAEDFEMSPDGKRLAFAATGPNGRAILWVRPLNSFTAQPLAGTDEVGFFFWSPDSRYLGFFAQGKMKKIDASGGPAQTLSDALVGRGGTWNRDGTIVYSPDATASLYRISAGGGTPAPLTTLDKSRLEMTHRWPQFLPDQRHYLYWARSSVRENSAVFVGSLDSKKRRLLVSGDSMALYAPPSNGGSGYLLFLRNRTLMAQPFDAGSLQLTGEPFLVAQPVGISGGAPGFGLFSVSKNGVLAWREGGDVSFQLTWFDRTGKPLGVVAPAGVFHPALSPDARQVAVARNDLQGGAPDIWVLDLARGTPTRFTFDPSTDWLPVWSPDGSRVAFASNRERAMSLYTKLSSGAGKEELVLKTDESKFLTDWSRDGKFMVYSNLNIKTSWDVFVLPLSGDRKPFPFVQTPFMETQGRLSPDGRWMAYTSNESGTSEIYVQPFPASGAKWQVSNGGGAQARWRRDGKELFYLAADRKLMAVEVKAGAAFASGIPKPLFDTRVSTAFPVYLFNDYDVTADGQRFLVASSPEAAAAAPIAVEVNWAAGRR